MGPIQVTVTDANNLTLQVTPTPSQTVTIDRGVAGNGIVSIVPVTISTFQYLRITYTNGTVSDVGPLTSTAYTATSPINITGNTISLTTVPIASGGTGQVTANAAFNALAPSQTGNSGKFLTTDGTNTSWSVNPLGTVTSVAVSGGTTGLTTSGGPITTSGTITLAGTLAVANGGTGVTTSSGVNSVVLRDANGNITTNCLFEGYSSQAASGTTIVLTASSVQNWQITGSGGQTIKLPDATTLPNGATFTFNNNQSSGAITVQNNSSTTIATIQSGGYVTIVLLSNSIAAGSWDRHDSTPSNVSWSTNTLDYAGSITSATWNGNAVAINRGGTGQSTAAAAITALTGTQTSGYYLRSNGTNAVLAAIQAADVPTLNQNTTGTAANVTGTVAITNGGTGQTTANTAFNALAPAQTGNSGKFLTTDGTNTLWATNPLGTVTSVSGTGTVNGLTLTGTVTTSGSLTLGGMLDLSSPPAIGGTTPSTGKFTTLTNTGLTSGRVVYSTTGGLETDSANLLYSGTDLTVYGITVGRGAGAVSTNTAVGNGALFSNTSGALNSAFGGGALQSNTTGNYNTAAGGSDNTFGSALYSNTTGGNNSAFGNGALGRNTTGNYNVAIGMQALSANTTASNNTAVGYQAAYNNTTVGAVTAVGYQAAYGITTGNSSADAFGYIALKALTSGVSNAAFGAVALQSNTTGSYNTAMGRDALQANTTASNNTAVGYQAGYSNQTGTRNTFVGYIAGTGVTSNYNAVFGSNAGSSLTSNGFCTFIGDYSGNSTTGANNTFVGQGSGYLVTTGAKNTIIGGFNGNQGGLDIRTANNKVVVSDGDGLLALHNDSSQWTTNPFGNIDVTNNSTTTNVLAVTANTATLLFSGNAFSGVFIINDINVTGGCAICIVGGGSLSIFAQSGATTFFVNSSSPSTNQIGVYLNGNTATVKTNPNGGGTTNFRIIAFRTRTSS